MNKTIILSWFLLSTLACDGPPAVPVDVSLPVETLATTLVNSLAAGEYNSVVAMFDDTMKDALPTWKLMAAWRGVTVTTGDFVSAGAPDTKKIGVHTAVFVPITLERGAIVARVVFLSQNGRSAVAGLFFEPPASARSYRWPKYVDPKRFTEREVSFGEEPWRLPGTLSVPVGPGPWPAMVLVHGSGPNDRDETVGGIKLFADLAGGLASRGIAVLRYDKRTKVHGAAVARLPSLTVKEESVDDALAAAAWLRGLAEIRPGHVFVLGHSLGGTVAPRIGARDPQLGGLVIMAGATRPLEDLYLEQVEYILGLDGAFTSAERAQLARAKIAAARVKKPIAETTPTSELLLSVPASYWNDLRTYRPAKLAATLRHRMLILQGGRDYQVTMTDFGGWKESLAGKAHVRFEHFPSLNHLFVTGVGPSMPAEYEREAHAAEEAVLAVAAFVNGSG